LRLTSLALRNYGSFADSTLRFDPAPGRVNLVLAPNGAGKSVLRSAFGDLLFGIGGQTPMGFRHGYPGMQILAEGIGPDGTPFTLDRRKKAGSAALLGADGQPLGPATLAALLGPADRSLLERLFALDTERLRAGGQALLASGGALAEALLQAAGGLRQAKALQDELEDARNRLAPTRRRAQAPFYTALDRLTEGRRREREKLVRPEAWLARNRALGEARQRHAEAQQGTRDAAAALYRLERIRRIRPLLARLDAATAWLEAHPAVPRLAVDLGERLAAARHAAAQAAEALLALRRQAEELRNQIALVRPEAEVLARAEAIRALREAAGVASSARAALPAAEAAWQAAEARIAEHLAAFGLPPDTAERLPPAVPVRRARQLAEAESRLSAALADLRKRVALQETALKTAALALAQLQPAADAEGLSPLLAGLAAEGDPARLAAAAARDVAQARAELAAEAARLPATLRDLPALRGLALPQRSELERLSRARDTAEETVRRAGAECSRLQAEGQRLRAERAGLDREGTLPDEEALARARDRRDVGWHLVYHRAFLPAPPDEDAERAFAGAEPLPLAYARAVAEADAMADQRLRETARLAKAAELDRAMARNGSETEAAAALAQAAANEAAAAATLWNSTIRPAGLDDGCRWPELDAVLKQREVVLNAALALERASAEAQRLAEQHASDARRLVRALRLEEATGLDLRALIDLAAARQEEARRGLEARAAAAARHDAAIRALDEARHEEADAVARMVCWQAEWRDAWDALDRAPPGRAEEGLALLDLYGTLHALAAQAREAKASASRMNAEIGSFRAECTRLGLQAGESAEDALGSARALGQRLDEAQQQQSRLDLLQQQERQLAAQIEAARRHGDEAAAALRGTLGEAGAATPEEAALRLAVSAEWQRQAGERDTAQQALLRDGEGLALETLRAEAGGVATEALEEALAAARAEQQAQADRISETAAEAARLQAEQDALDADDSLALAVQDQQGAITQIGRTLEDALLAQLAASLLEAAMQRVQEGGDDAMLRRIGAAFATLTEDAYPAVQSREDDKGVAHLVIRRRDHPEEETTVEALSEGTRDQLFLALRLVAIEDQVAGGTALPFLGDDILQSFDDRRAAAAFRALLRFSETTQVILLSHHRHLGEVAAAALPTGALHLQSLDQALPLPA
jgi:uncharacterized protein YhaN